MPNKILSEYLCKYFYFIDSNCIIHINKLNYNNFININNFNNIINHKWLNNPLVCKIDEKN